MALRQALKKVVPYLGLSRTKQIPVLSGPLLFFNWCHPSGKIVTLRGLPVLDTLFTHRMEFVAESFIGLQSYHLVQIVNSACDSLWDISITPGQKESCMENVPRKYFGHSLVRV